MKRVSCFIIVISSCIFSYAGLVVERPDLPDLVELQNMIGKIKVAAVETEDSSFIKEVVMDIVASDGNKLKATYYTSGKAGPGMLLLHQCNMDRKSWKTLATALAQRGIHVLTFDYRGYGETPRSGNGSELATDIDAALKVLVSQPGVNQSHIAAGGASCGVNNAIELAKRSGKIKALMLLSGPVSPEGLNYLKANPGLAIFGAASSEEDFAVKAITEMVGTSKNPISKMTVLHNAGHGAPMFSAAPKLLPAITEWMIKVLK